MELVNILYRNFALQIMQFVEDPKALAALQAVFHAARAAGVESKQIFESMAHAASLSFTPEAVNATVAKVFPKDVPEAVQKSVAELPKDAVPAEAVAEVAAAAHE